MRKSLVLLFAICHLPFAISGCAKAPQAVTAPKKILVWHWMTDREETFNKLAQEYKKLSGVEVVFELYAPSDAYSQKVMAAGQTKALPDIYGILGEKRILAAFVDAGGVADLTVDMEYNNGAWKNTFFKKALEINEFLPGNQYGARPGIYAVPIDVINIQMLYNKRLFQQAGLDPRFPPATWPDFISALEKLKQTGIKGLVSGWGETWMIDCFAHNYAFNIMGEEKVIATIKGQVPYNDPDWIKVFELFNELARKGFLLNGIVTMENKTAEQLFANEKCAFAFNGSWCVNVYKAMNPDLEYAAMLPPLVSNKYPMAIWGGAGSSFMVNERSKNKQEAVNFLRWFTQEKQQAFLSKQTMDLPSNKDSLGYLPEALSQFADDMDSATHPNILPIQENPRVLEAFAKGIQAIIIGVRTPQQVADDLQNIKKRIMQQEIEKK